MFLFQNEAGTIQIDYMKRSGYFTMPGHHAHNEYELYYLFNGERDYFIRDRTYRVERGSFVFIEKEELHRTIDTGVPNHERVVFNFDACLMEDLPLTGKSGVIKLPPQEQHKGEDLVRELMAEAKRNEPGRDRMLELLLKQLLILLFRAQANQPEPEVLSTSVYKIMSDVAAYVGEHYAEPLLLKDVAKRFYISPYYLSRKFKQCTGFGFAEYVQLVRIREAQRLLRETDLNIIEIAERTGIKPVANFHRLFKKLNGCTPRQYRKRQR